MKFKDEHVYIEDDAEDPDDGDEKINGRNVGILFSNRSLGRRYFGERELTRNPVENYRPLRERGRVNLFTS